ncbi:acetyltransferase [Salinibacter ruber]|uniref:UDP-perosamine 4-acetyltransferase n=1 Tax=Salinibacter ruber TaxID=146919 RepID=A0A9X2V7K9_9BACT|nr:UDP-perosamine 4-acetyltransferase [Salinibacter ruber]
MTERPFIILGGGGHARVVRSTLRQLGHTILGFTDPDEDASLEEDIDHLGPDAVLFDYTPTDVVLTVAIASTQDTTLRARTFKKQRRSDFDFPSIVHPRAVVAPEAAVGAGTQVAAGAVVQPGTTLAENVIVNTNASVDHDSEIGAHTHIAPGATVSGSVSIGARAHIGTGASLIQGIHVGPRSVVGAGAVVIEDVPPDSIVVGVPAVQK